MNTRKHLSEIYRAVIPESVRSSAFITKLKTKLLGHDWMYNAEYYSYVEEFAQSSVKWIARSICSDLHCKRVVDVGCGTGALLEELRNLNCEILGLEISETALEYCRSKNLNVKKFDLTKDALKPSIKYDVAISTEVAEHLPECVADGYVALLSDLSDIIIFTAAKPDDGGLCHFNEQPTTYWITKFEHHGFVHDDQLTQQWHDQWKEVGDVAPWYYQNLMVFRHG